MVTGEKVYTYAEYQDYLRQHPDKLLELIDGRIVEKITGESHGIIALNIAFVLRAWHKQSGIAGHSGVEAPSGDSPRLAQVIIHVSINAADDAGIVPTI